jgi:hypothetical protein
MKKNLAFLILFLYPECSQNGSWSGLSQEEILKLNDFLYRNAWGTYSPNDAESCG